MQDTTHKDDANITELNNYNRRMNEPAVPVLFIFRAAVSTGQFVSYTQPIQSKLRRCEKLTALGC